MIARLQVAGDNNPYRTPTDNMPVPSIVWNIIENYDGKDPTSLAKMQYHEHGGFRIFIDPETMHWRLLDIDAKEPLGIVRGNRDKAHTIIDDYSRKQERINLIDRIISESEEDTRNTEA